MGLTGHIPVLHGELYLGEQEDSWGDWEVMRVPY